MLRSSFWSTIVISLVAVAIAPLGCDSEDGSDGGADGGGDGDGDGGGQESPRDGIWSYNEGVLLENTCGVDDVALDPDTNFEIINEGGDTFVIPQNSPYEDFTCTKTGSDFTCPARLKGEIPIDMTDIVLSYEVDVNGTLDDAESMFGTQRADIECSGSQCAIAGTLGYTFPCYYVVDFSATWETDY